MNEAEASGLPIREYCGQHDVHEGLFYQGRHRLELEARKSKTEPGLVLVPIIVRCTGSKLSSGGTARSFHAQRCAGGPLHAPLKARALDSKVVAARRHAGGGARPGAAENADGADLDLCRRGRDGVTPVARPMGR